MNISVLWYIKPCSVLKVNRCFVGKFRFHLQTWRLSQWKNEQEAIRALCFLFLLLSAATLNYSSTLKMEATLSSETLENFYRIIRRSLHSHRFANFKCNAETKMLINPNSCYSLYFGYDAQGNLPMLEYAVQRNCGRGDVNSGSDCDEDRPSLSGRVRSHDDSLTTLKSQLHARLC